MLLVCHVMLFLSSLSACWISPLEVKCVIFRNGEKWNWKKHQDQNSQHKIINPYYSGMSQTSLQTEKVFTVIEYKHTHIHTTTHSPTHPPPHTHTHKHTKSGFKGGAGGVRPLFLQSLVFLRSLLRLRTTNCVYWS